MLGEKSYEKNLQLAESSRVKERSWSCMSRNQNLASTVKVFDRDHFKMYVVILTDFTMLNGKIYHKKINSFSA